MTEDDWKKVSDHANELDAIETALNKADVPVDVSLFKSEEVGQPYNLASRVLWLISDRNKTAAERNQLQHVLDELSKILVVPDGFPIITRAAELIAERDALKASNDAAFSGLAQAHREHDQLRKMYDDASADLDRERREHQEAMAEAAARELKLTEERDNARSHRASFMNQRDAAIQDASFFKSEAEKAVADLAEVSAALDKAGVPRSVDSMGNMITPAGRVAVLLALHERLAPPKRRSKTKPTKKLKAAAKRGRRKP